MARVWLLAYDSNARESIRVVNKLLGLPRAGVHVGGGIHVEQTADPASPGWTLRHAWPLRNTVLLTRAYPVDDTLLAAGADSALRSRLDASELVYLDAKRATIMVSVLWEITDGGNVEEYEP